MWRRALVAVAVFAAIVGLSGPASADPKGDLLDLTCTGVPSGQIATNGNGQWTPGLNLASNGVYIPYAFEFKVYFTPDGGAEILVESDSVAKRNVPKNSKNHPHGVCEFGESFPVDDPDLGVGTGRFEGTVSVFYTG